MVQEIVSGLSMGCIYALVGFGFVLIYNALGAVNFAYGEVVMFGGYFGLMATTWLGLPLWGALIFSLVTMAALGIFNMLFAYYPMRHRPVVTVIIASIGMSILLRNSALAIWGPDPLKLESFLGDGIINIGGVVVVRHQILIFAVTILVFFGQYLFVCSNANRAEIRSYRSGSRGCPAHGHKSTPDDHADLCLGRSFSLHRRIFGGSTLVPGTGRRAVYYR